MAHRAEGLSDIFEHDVRVRKNLDTNGGTIQKTPANDKDIVNKEYVDTAVSGIDLSAYVEKAGDTMTGPLLIEEGSASDVKVLGLTNPVSNQGCYISFGEGGGDNMHIGYNGSSNFLFIRKTGYDPYLEIDRDSGDMDISSNVSITGNLTINDTDASVKIYDINAGQSLSVGRNDNERLKITSDDSRLKLEFYQDYDEGGIHSFDFDFRESGSTPDFSLFSYRFKIDTTDEFIISDSLIDAKSKPINNVTDPTSAQDVATKNYVDTEILNNMAKPLIKNTLNSYDVDASAVQVFDASADSDDVYITLCNAGDFSIYLYWTSSVSSTLFFKKLVSGETYGFPLSYENATNNDVYAIRDASATDDNVIVTTFKEA